jgi:hypothetical protein
MSNSTVPDFCPVPEDGHHPSSVSPPPFSPLGWSMWRRLAVSVTVCAVLWVVVLLWALD